MLFPQYALSDHLNDGRQNLLGAIMIAGHYVIPEVNAFCGIIFEKYIPCFSVVFG